jgi:hypothetical protein
LEGEEMKSFIQQYRNTVQIFKDEDKAFIEAYYTSLEKLEQKLDREILHIEGTTGDLKRDYESRVTNLMAAILYRLEMEEFQCHH